MKLSVEDRIERVAAYIVENGSTVRKTASEFGISKSTVHKDLTERLRRHNPAMYSRVKVVLDKNREERHIRGGAATREKYRCLKLAK